MARAGRLGRRPRLLVRMGNLVRMGRMGLMGNLVRMGRRPRDLLGRVFRVIRVV